MAGTRSYTRCMPHDATRPQDATGPGPDDLDLRGGPRRPPREHTSPGFHEPRKVESEPDTGRALASERLDYTASTLDDRPGDGQTDDEASPFPLFRRWLDDAFARRESHGDLPEPSAVVLSTIDVTGPLPRPASRTVLMKDFDERGFVVYTNKRSAKGRQLAADPWAAMLFPWYPLQRQVRIEGRMVEVDDAEADAYWASRPRASQIGAWASEQSQPIDDRDTLDRRVVEAELRFRPVESIPRPPHWGGYRLVPERIEFWQGRSGRVHDRIVHTTVLRGTRAGMAAAWKVERLQP